MKVRPRTEGRSRNAGYQQRHRERKVPVAFAQQRGESVAWMFPVCLETSRCHPVTSTSTSECPQLHLGTPWGSRRRKRLERKKSGMKRKWNLALKWKGKQATVVRVSFCRVRIGGSPAAQQKALQFPIPACSLPNLFNFVVRSFLSQI